MSTLASGGVPPRRPATTEGASRAHARFASRPRSPGKRHHDFLSPPLHPLPVLSCAPPASLPFALETSLDALIHLHDPAFLTRLDVQPQLALHAFRQRPASSTARRASLAPAWRGTPPSAAPRAALLQSLCAAPAAQLPPAAEPPAACGGGGAAASARASLVSVRDGGAEAGVRRSTVSKPSYKRRFALRRWAMVRRRLQEILEMESSKRTWRGALGDWHERSAEQALRGLQVLQGQDDQVVSALLEHTSVVTLMRYAELFARGRPMGTFYVVLQAARRGGRRVEGKGVVQLWGWRELGCVRTLLRKRDKPRRVLPGSILAGGAWLDEAIHITTATAEQPSVLLAIRVAKVKEDPRLAEVVERFKRVEGIAWKAQLLRDHVPLFSDLHISRLRMLAPIFTTAVVPRGEVIIREGEVGDKCYVLVTGEVLCYRYDSQGVEHRLRSITDSADCTYFGEMALHQHCVRTCYVRAAEESIILVIEKSNFEVFQSEIPEFEERIRALQAYDQAKRTASTEFLAVEAPPAACSGSQHLRKVITRVQHANTLTRHSNLSLQNWVSSLAPAQPHTIVRSRGSCQPLSPAARRRSFHPNAFAENQGSKVVVVRSEQSEWCGFSGIQAEGAPARRVLIPSEKRWAD
ncbi:hypothetical protein AB1Y20_020962 [Prymnesium parvum]|uniref:Cyclic nucleotide-binding domain-containing protein n=1 Tax=Prymnesium parvum TaxID=97485 RepID=A0AB34JJY9_PRYPA